jgi:AcrR family transcriptional regulator
MRQGFVSAEEEDRPDQVGFRSDDRRDPAESVRARILHRAHEAFWTHGYAALTMGKLAEACGLTRRGLYYHFSDKEGVFRATIQFFNGLAFELADAAARQGLAQGDAAVDVIATWLDIRFGDTRRRVGSTSHGRELNDVAFRLAYDLMIEVSYETNGKLALLIEELVRGGQLTLREGMSPDKTARLVGDGARGVNQARPPIPNDMIAQHYREITEAILYGCAVSIATFEATPGASLQKMR